MSWEISHSAEAWSNAYANLEDKTQKWLAEACATVAADRQESLDKTFWDACWDLGIDDSNIDNVPNWRWSYDRALSQLADVPHDVLVDEAFRYIEANNTCDNGGFNFYVDTGGFYTVSCDRDDISGAYPD